MTKYMVWFEVEEYDDMDSIVVYVFDEFDEYDELSEIQEYLENNSQEWNEIEGMFPTLKSWERI